LSVSVGGVTFLSWCQLVLPFFPAGSLRVLPMSFSAMARSVLSPAWSLPLPPAFATPAGDGCSPEAVPTFRGNTPFCVFFSTSFLHFATILTLLDFHASAQAVGFLYSPPQANFPFFLRFPPKPSRLPCLRALMPVGHPSPPPSQPGPLMSLQNSPVLYPLFTKDVRRVVTSRPDPTPPFRACPPRLFEMAI